MVTDGNTKALDTWMNEFSSCPRADECCINLDKSQQLQSLMDGFDLLKEKKIQMDSLSSSKKLQGMG
jgi:hypothetical protein